MQIIDFEYFVAVATHENMNLAARLLKVSPATLSRAVEKIESEFGAGLFLRVGKSIQLNQQGKFFLTQARAILDQVQTIHHGLSNKNVTAELRISGRSALIDNCAAVLLKTWSEKLNLNVCFFERSGDAALESVRSGESHLSMTTQNPGNEYRATVIGSLDMVVCAAVDHRLARSKLSWPIQAILKCPWVAPHATLFTEVHHRITPDGWRDDRYPRNVQVRTDSLAVLEELCLSGLYLAYLPGGRAKNLGLKVLEVVDENIRARFNIHLGMRKTLQAAYVSEAFAMAQKANLQNDL
ncbi:MAG: LysR family transcriptional regulator [Proteobacteria bacterium]|nr:LysR family transcriptional regulator [Pseudomonadota bacterium]